MKKNCNYVFPGFYKKDVNFNAIPGKCEIKV